MNTPDNIFVTREKEASQYERNNIYEQFINSRNFSELLCSPLETEDYCIQSMPDVSPAKWHLAHTSWFYEAFLLHNVYPDYKPLNPLYNYLFNSYYVQIGERFQRAARGLLSRPTVKEVYKYRAHINHEVKEFIYNCSDEQFNMFAPVIIIGINHEQQHQELILTDIKHVFSLNPLHPVYKESAPAEAVKSVLSWQEFEGGVVETGYDGRSFCFDNETPLHKSFLYPFVLSHNEVTNSEYMEFIEDKGYSRAELWLSDGYAAAAGSRWNAPLYWTKENNEWWHYTLNGYKKVNPHEPVCHISYYEADAFARWKGYRLPLEEEWETASGNINIEGNFVEAGKFHPEPANKGSLLNNMFGNVWEWTMSPYMPYPGYKPLPGTLGEYNGKFMSGQVVLRGGSCATPESHIRKTYRNFFPPHSRWQFSGIRLAGNTD
jgi:ergothioneine biosynthesis protein EgtB